MAEILTLNCFQTYDDENPDCYSHDIEQLENGNFKVVLKVASAFFAQIIGKGGQTKVRLESDTKTKINIPRKGKDGDIIVTGQSRNGVVLAANRYLWFVPVSDGWSLISQLKD